MTDWSDAVSWEGDGLRREVFYIRSGSADVFVSLWQPAGRTAAFGLLLCPAWGFEGTSSGDLQVTLARAAAERGGLGVVFHYPGHDDSTGDPETATVDVMTQAAVDCARSVGDRVAGGWILCGSRFGATIATLASAELEPAAILLVEDELDPEGYFDGLLRRARRATLAYSGSKHLAFGVPVSAALLRSAQNRSTEVRAALSSARCPIQTIRYRGSPRSSAPGAAQISVGGQGNWLARNVHRPLVDAATRWLDSEPS